MGESSTLSAFDSISEGHTHVHAPEHFTSPTEPAFNGTSFVCFVAWLLERQEIENVASHLMLSRARLTEQQ